jgi:signal transduction histidine kinase
MERRATRLTTIKTKRTSAARARSQSREVERFESLVVELSAAMARVPADSVDQEIDLWLGKICQSLDLDRCAVYERQGPNDPVLTTHTWVRKGFPPLPRGYRPETHWHRRAKFVMEGNVSAFSSPDEIPNDEPDAKRFVKRYGPKASASVPMWAGDKVIGAASFGKFRAPRKWTSELLANLSLAVRLFGNAIERKQSEETARLLRSELRVSTRRNLMSELVASLSHEVNQPLGAILSNLGGVSRLLAEGNPKPTLALEAVSNALKDTQRTAEIVQRIRSMFKRHVQRRSAISIGVLVEGVLKLISGEARVRRVSVQSHVAPSIHLVIGDDIELQQCLLNLVMNSMDAIADAKADRREVFIKVVPERTGWVALSVSDSGAGIAANVADRLFEPFVTTKHEGMGLGLLVTRSIIESHGGKIWTSPNPEGGATFTFTLPVAERKRSRMTIENGPASH